ncbi:hypothetical protein pb186bvf_016268 [Paramecium bursaria]
MDNCNSHSIPICMILFNKKIKQRSQDKIQKRNYKNYKLQKQ